MMDEVTDEAVAREVFGADVGIVESVMPDAQDRLDRVARP